MNDTVTSNSQSKATKILLLGLDNSGKTSILLSLQGNTNLLSFFALKPTPGLNIVNFEDKFQQFHIWEFGGQKKYRVDYLKKLKEYMHETDKVFFVIDVQDIERYEIALQYFSAIYYILKRSDEGFELSIFLHKFDPDLRNDPKFSDDTITSNLINPIRKILGADSEVLIFKTSIYTVFRKTSFNAEPP